MATETPASHQSPVSDEPIETKVIEVKPTEVETSAEEEEPSSKELPSQSIPSEKLVDKEIDDAPTSEAVSDSASSQTTVEPPLATTEQAEPPVDAAVAKVEEEKPKVADAPESSDEITVKQVDEPESVVPGVDEHAHEQSEVTNETEKIESEQVFGEAKDSSGTVSLKSEEVDKLGTEVPIVEVKQEEEAKFEEPEDRSFLETDKVHDPVVVPATDEPKSVAVQDVNNTVALPKQIETPQLVVPEAEVNPEEPKQEKPREQPLEATEKVDDPVDSKAEEELKLEKTEEPSSETPQHVIPEAEVNQEEQIKLEKPVEQQPLEAAEKVDNPLVVIASDESEAAAVQNTDGTVATAEVKQEEEIKFDKPKEPSSEAAEKQVETPLHVIPEAEVKQEEETKFEKPEEQSLEATEKQVETPQLVIPEAEVKQEEEPKFEKPEEQPFEATEKVADPVATIESTAAIQDTDDTEALETPQIVVPKAEVKLEEQSEAPEQVEKQEREILQPEVKHEEHSVISKEVEEPEPAIPEVQVKPEEQSGNVEQVETKLKDENPETIKVTEAIDQGTEGDTIKEVTTLVSTVADTESANVEKSDTEEKASASVISEQAVSTAQEDQADPKQVQGDITDEAVAENEKKQINGSDVVEVSSKEAIEEKGNAGEELETKEENLEKHPPKEEVAEPIKVEEVKDSVSNVEVTERSFEVAKSYGVEPPAEDKTEGNEKEETRASVEAIKKLDEATVGVTETTKEAQDLVSDGKRIESATTIENEEKKEKAEEPDVQNNKDGEESKGTQEQAREVSGKPTQKQSNNIFTKVKQSLVKAKKAITGKSPNPKTLSSDTKDDIKVK